MSLGDRGEVRGHVTGRGELVTEAEIYMTAPVCGFKAVC